MKDYFVFQKNTYVFNVSCTNMASKHIKLYFLRCDVEASVANTEIHNTCSSFLYFHSFHWGCFGILIC